MGTSELEVATLLQKQTALEEELRFVYLVCYSFLVVAVLLSTAAVIWWRQKLNGRDRRTLHPLTTGIAGDVTNPEYRKDLPIAPGDEGNHEQPRGNETVLEQCNIEQVRCEDDYSSNEDRIEPVRVLGFGVNGAVHLVRKLINGRQRLVAQKVIRPSKAQDAEHLLRLLNKFKTLSSESPFLLAIMDYKYVRSPVEHVVLSTEYCSEGTLKDLAARDEMSDLRAFACGIQVLKALEFLHCNGIVHRDIKGENVLLTRKGQVDCIKLGDFDFAAMLDNLNSRNCDVCYGVGTVPFMAPEVLVGSATGQTVGRSSDIWSFACMMVQLASGGQIRCLRNSSGQFISATELNINQLGFEVANGAVPEMYGIYSEYYITKSAVENSIAFFSGWLQACWREAPQEYGHNSTQYRPSASDLLCCVTDGTSDPEAVRSCDDEIDWWANFYEDVPKKWYPQIDNVIPCSYLIFHAEKVHTMLRSANERFVNAITEWQNRSGILTRKANKTGTQEDACSKACVAAFLMPPAVAGLSLLPLPARKGPLYLLSSSLYPHTAPHCAVILLRISFKIGDSVRPQKIFRYSARLISRKWRNVDLQRRQATAVSMISSIGPLENRIDPDMYSALNLLCTKENVDMFLKDASFWNMGSNRLLDYEHLDL